MKTTLCFKLIFTSTIILSSFSFSCNKEEVSISERGVGPSVSALYAGSAAFSANGSTGTAYSGTVRLPYNGGNGATYSSGNSIASTGVTGLTAKLQPGILTTGPGNLMYTINGTPKASGIAYFVLGFGTQTCTLQLSISP